MRKAIIGIALLFALTISPTQVVQASEDNIEVLRITLT